MNTDGVIVSLLADIYGQLLAAQQRIQELEAEIAASSGRKGI